MAGNTLNYPPEIVDAVATMRRAAKQLDQEMADLKRLVDGLVGSSRGAAVEAFDEVQRLWNKSGFAHNEALAAVAGAAGDSYEQISSFDNQVANQLAP